MKNGLLPVVAAIALSIAIPTTGLAVPVAQKELDLVLQRTPDPKNGAKLYETCAACHGPKGEGVSDGTVPALGGQPYTIVAKQLVDFRAGVRGDPRMAHFSDTRHLAYSQHIADVSAHIATLPPPAPKTEEKTAGSAQAPALYSRHCERCHGVHAEGKEDFLAPRLGAQHREYLARQLEDAAEGRRPAMAESHTALVKTLSPDQLLAITAFLASGAR